MIQAQEQTTVNHNRHAFDSFAAEVAKICAECGVTIPDFVS